MRLAPRLALLLGPALLAGPAPAASEVAWEEFRRNVMSACTALVTDPGTVTVEVNPFGSQSYGAALVTLSAPAGADRMICIFDKVTGKAELTAAFAE
jgi:hypothetical protein